MKKYKKIILGWEGFQTLFTLNTEDLIGLTQYTYKFWSSCFQYPHGHFIVPLAEFVLIAGVKVSPDGRPKSIQGEIWSECSTSHEVQNPFLSTFLTLTSW